MKRRVLSVLIVASLFAKDAPARMQVITAEEIRRGGYRSLVDVLKDLPDFKIDIADDQDYPTELARIVRNCDAQRQ